MSTRRTRNRHVDAVTFLEGLNKGPLSLGQLIAAIRLGEELTQPELAKKLGITKSSLNDLEKKRKLASPERAARYAKILGYPPQLFVQLSLQDQLRESGLKMTVEVKAA